MYAAKEALKACTSAETVAKLKQGIMDLLMQHRDFFTTSQLELLDKGFDSMTDSMIRRLLKCDFLNEDQKAFLLRQLLLRSNKISYKTRRLLECGGALTKEALEELLRLGLITMSQLRLLDKTFIVPLPVPSAELVDDELKKEEVEMEEVPEKELMSEMLFEESKSSSRESKEKFSDKSSIKVSIISLIRTYT